MPVVSMKALLESGAHFGHRTQKWHPDMREFIYTERNKIHIIDLQQTARELERVYKAIVATIADGGTMLFVGTKRQAQDSIITESVRCGMPSVSARWLGGTLTNWRTIRERINELDRLERLRDQGGFARYKKKEALSISRKIEKLERDLGGIRKMVHLPDLLFVVDINREATAIHEANLLKIPVIAMVDTNCDPSKIDYVIPANDDAIRSIKLITSIIANAVEEGKASRKDEEEKIIPDTIEMDYASEDEITDEELLGAATLAKLEAQRVEEQEARDAEVAAAQAEVEKLEAKEKEEVEATEVPEEEITEVAEDAEEEVLVEAEVEIVEETETAAAEEPAEKVQEEEEK